MKRQGAEFDDGPRIPAISDFIEGELGRLENSHPENKGVQAPVAQLDRIFRSALQEAWKV